MYEQKVLLYISLNPYVDVCVWGGLGKGLQSV